MSHSPGKIEKAQATIRRRLKSVERYLRPAVRCWQRFPSFAQLLLKSVSIGLAAAIFLHLARPYLPGVYPAERAATDWAINFWKDRSVESPRSAERFVFLDIDESTYQQWGEQLFVPREKLLRLIQFAIEARARLLVVDTELTKHVGVAPILQTGLSSKSGLSDPDEALRAYLESYSRGMLQVTAPVDADRGPVTDIIFVRSIGQPLRQTGMSGQELDREETTTGIPIFSEERPSEFLEAVVSPSPILHWASSLIERDDDGVLRDWRLFEPTCIREAPNVIPSIALLTWALLREPRLDNAPFSIQRFRAELRRRFSPPGVQCSHRSGLPAFEPNRTQTIAWQLDDPLLNKSVLLSMRSTDFEHRIFYKFHTDSVQADSFSHIRAAVITDPQLGRPLSVDWLTGKIVVIGASYAAANDRHATPIGEMPGAMVVINEMNALLEFGQIRELDPRIKWTVLVSLIIAFSLSFSYFTKAWGTRIARLVVNAILIPLSLWLFQYGWWLDVVFPLLVLQAYGHFVDFDVKSQAIKREHISSESRQ